MAETVVKIGNISGKDCDKFEKFKLNALKAEKVKSPLIEQCVANLECKLVDVVEKYDYLF